MRKLLFTLFCLTSLLLHASSIWEEGSQWEVYEYYQSTGIDSSEVAKYIVTYRLLHADDNYMALEKTVTFLDEVVSTEVQGYIRNDHDRVIYVRPVLEDGSIGDECVLYDFREPYEYGGTVRYGVIGGEVMEDFIDWQQDTLDYYMLNNGDTHCLPAWKGIIYQYGYIGGPMELFLLKAAPGKTKRPKPTNISHVIFSTKGGHKTIFENPDEDEVSIIIPYDVMLNYRTTWECLSVSPEQPDLKDTYTIQVMGDTLIGTRRCKQVYSPEQNIQKTLFEEGRKVYIVNADGNPEVLLDFNLQEGDCLDEATTVLSVWNQENLGYHYRTITIDMGFDCESYFEGDTAPWAYDLIEGIGVSKDQYLMQRFINEKNTISYLLRCWKEGTLVYRVPQECEYVPFVREGVKWVYYYDNPIEGISYEDGFIPSGIHYYTFEMKGDTVINGKNYKPVHLYSGESVNETNDTVPVYLREENKVVYGIIPDDKRYYECPIGIGTEVLGFDLCSTVQTGVEFILYDFNDPAGFYESLDGHVHLHYDHADLVGIGSHWSKKHVFNHGMDDYYFGEESIIEGIGFVGDSPGMPLNYFYGITVGMTQVTNRLSHVIEDGETVYKTKWYKEPVPDDYEYVPFVREGVKWVYAYDNVFREDILDMPSGHQYYSFELKGDVQIGDKIYKPVVLTHYLDKDGQTKEVEDYTPICLREENKVVYAIHPDGIQHPQCPVGYGWFIGYPDEGLPIYSSNEEFALYNFNDPMALYSTQDYWGEVDYCGTEMMTIGGKKRKCHHYQYQSWYNEDDFIIEGIGYDGMAGFPLFYFELFITGFQVGYGLSHVIEDGQVVYTGRWYDPGIHVGIDEVVADKTRRLLDDNYYDLMGRCMGTEVPMTPGIYIHQGKKIVVR